MSTLTHDLRYAVRMLRKTPLFTGIAVFTLALGIGLNTAVFSAVDALILRPLPGVREPDRLVHLFRTWPSFETGANSVPHFRDIHDRATDVFSSVTAWTFVPVNLASGGRTERITGQIVSADFFTVLGASAARGRTFVAAEDSAPGAHPVVVVSDAAWKGMFGGDPQIVGRAILLNGRKYTVIGVTAPEFRGPVALVTPAVWVPLIQIGDFFPGREPALTERGESFLNVIARLEPNVTAAQARDRMNRLVSELRTIYPKDYEDSGINLFTQREAGPEPKIQRASLALSSVVMAVVFMLLLIACVNVANLFLARARDRWREMAVRLSIGAARGQLVRQLLTESVLFSLIAGAAGLVIAYWAIGLVNQIRLPIDIAIAPDLRLSMPVLLFTLAISMATGVIFGLAPALQATRPALVPALKGEAPAGGSRSRMSRGLVIAQISLSLVLLVCAGLFLRSLREATTMDVGFTADNLLIGSLDPGLQGYPVSRQREFYARFTERLRAIPTVKSVATADAVPLGLGSQQTGVRIPGYTPSKNENMSIDFARISPDYFEALGITLRRGRGILASDDSSAQGAMVINQRFADRFWPGEDPIGKTVHTDGRDHLVVGVVPNGKYRSLGESPLAYMYIPVAQHWTSDRTLYVRTSGDPLAIAPMVRNELAAIDPDIPLSDLRPMRRHLGIALLPSRLVGGVLAIFGVLGLVLAAVGIYGVMSYSVARRTREIGIRMAVGAAGGEVVRLVIRQGLSLVAVGIAVGLAGALVGARLVRGLLYGTAVLDPVAFLGVPTILAAIAVLAIWVPARRAARVDPMVALRIE